MNSVCSNQSKGWLCIRVEHLEKIFERSTTANKKKAQSINNITTMTTKNWCSGADDWGDEFGGGGGESGGVGCIDDDEFDISTISANQQPIYIPANASTNCKYCMSNCRYSNCGRPVGSSCSKAQIGDMAPKPPLDDNLNEQNGNMVMCNNLMLGKNENRNQSDDEDESNSMDDPVPMFNNLQLIDDKNANCGEQQGFLIFDF